MDEYERENTSEVTEEVVEDALNGMLNGYWGVEDSALEGARVRTFEQDGILTYNKGLVIRLPDGSEYQLTIVRSR